MPNVRTPARTPGRAGYTLVEMLLVVLILGIAGALVIPHTGQAHVLRVHAAVRTLVSDITFAQTDALAYQQRRAVIFSEENNTYTIAEVVVSSGGDVTFIPLHRAGGPGGQYVIDFDANGFDGARMRAPDFEGDAVLIFDELGAPIAHGAGDAPAGLGSVYIEGNLSTFRIDVLPYTGQVRVEQVDGVPDGGGNG
jgi:prepilin-type N-terminal cleavage/methylation domain-containing protein